MFRKTILATAMILGSSAAQADVFQFGMGNGLKYYQSSFSKGMMNGEVFFTINGFLVDMRSGKRTDFRALFNCGKYSKIAVDIEGKKALFPISGRVAAMQNNLGNWYSIQSLHCPNNHFEFEPRELVFQ